MHHHEVRNLLVAHVQPRGFFRMAAAFLLFLLLAFLVHGAIILMSRWLVKWLLNDYYEVMSHCVYRHIDKRGRLLYVGCSLNPVARLFQHQRSEWFRNLARIEIEHVGSKREALAKEWEIIIREKPIYNRNKRFPESKGDFVKYLKFLKKCADRNEKVFALHDKGWSQTDIAAHHKVSRQRIHQILSKRKNQRAIRDAS